MLLVEGYGRTSQWYGQVFHEMTSPLQCQTVNKKTNMCLWNMNAPAATKTKLAILSIKVIMLLTLVLFERVSLVEYACHI